MAPWMIGTPPPLIHLPPHRCATACGALAVDWAALPPALDPATDLCHLQKPGRAHRKQEQLASLAAHVLPWGTCVAAWPVAFRVLGHHLATHCHRRSPTVEQRLTRWEGAPASQQWHEMGTCV